MSVSPRRPRLRVLARRGEFINTFKSGRRIRPCDWMVFNFAMVEVGDFRCGWTLPRAVGSAVVRNRMKRWTRDWLKARLKLDHANGVGVPPVHLNIGFRAPPKTGSKRGSASDLKDVKRVEFNSAMEHGWNRLLAVTKQGESG